MYIRATPPESPAERQAALPPPDATPPTEVFTHKFLKDDSFRQRSVLSRLTMKLTAKHGPSPDLQTVVEVLRLAGERHAGGAVELAPELSALIDACAVPPLRQPFAAEEVNSSARGMLIDSIARLARSADAKLRSSAMAALTSLLARHGWPGTAERTPASLPPSQSMAVALAGVSESASADVVAALAEARGDAHLRDACAVVVCMARSSARVRMRLLDAGGAAVLVRRLAEQVAVDGQQLPASAGELPASTGLSAGQRRGGYGSAVSSTGASAAPAFFSSDAAAAAATRAPGFASSLDMAVEEDAGSAEGARAGVSPRGRTRRMSLDQMLGVSGEGDGHDDDSDDSDDGPDLPPLEEPTPQQVGGLAVALDTYRRRARQLPLTTHHAPRTTHHAPLTTHHSPLTTHHSPLTTHRRVLGRWARRRARQLTTRPSLALLPTVLVPVHSVPALAARRPAAPSRSAG